MKKLPRREKIGSVSPALNVLARSLGGSAAPSTKRLCLNDRHE